jgi:nucleoside 2-deoxyribosyltransferase
MILTSEEIERLAGLPSPSPAEKAARLLLELGHQCSQPGARMQVSAAFVFGAMEKIAAHTEDNEYPDDFLERNEKSGLELLGKVSASNDAELQWLIKDTLTAAGYLDEGRSFVYSGKGYPYLTITPRGWQEIDRLQQVNTASQIGFVAMSFLPTFLPLLDQGIVPGIEAAGYKAERVDRTEHNNRIDDEIIARIKQSRFVVADFTKQRGGIYFEAGYALGLGLRVIWLARENALKRVHFDNRQYNFITWQDGAWDELRVRLRFRIEATIGRGPLAPRN